MGTFALTNADVTVNTVDLSAWCKSVSLTLERDVVDDTNMGDTTVINLEALKNWSITITFSQDFAATKVDATLWSVYNSASGTCAVVIIPAGDTVGATNPSYTGTGLLTSMPVVDGSVGDHAEITATFVPAGNQVRATS